MTSNSSALNRVRARLDGDGDGANWSQPKQQGHPRHVLARCLRWSSCLCRVHMNTCHTLASTLIGLLARAHTQGAGARGQCPRIRGQGSEDRRLVYVVRAHGRAWVQGRGMHALHGVARHGVGGLSHWGMAHHKPQRTCKGCMQVTWAVAVPLPSSVHCAVLVRLSHVVVGRCMHIYIPLVVHCLVSCPCGPNELQLCDSCDSYRACGKPGCQPSRNGRRGASGLSVPCSRACDMPTAAPLLCIAAACSWHSLQRGTCAACVHGGRPVCACSRAGPW